MTALVIERHDTHWEFVLNRADKLNALSADLVEALIEAVDLAENHGVPVVIVRGAGRCFSAGFDMSGIDAQSDGDLLLRFVRIETLLDRIAASRCLTVAFAHGRNFGAGVDLFASCQVRIAAPDTTFQMPGLQFGIVLGSARFARIVGREVALAMLETSTTFDADWAWRHRFAERIEPVDRVTMVAAELVKRATALPPRSRDLLYEALDCRHADADLAMLVRSAAAPGLQKRILAYRAAASARRADMSR
jgi:enoyl-CoA hydratase